MEPLKQFEVHNIVPIKIGVFDLSITNSSIAMVVATLAAVLILRLMVRKESIIPGRLQAIAEMLIGFVSQLAEDINADKGRPYFPFIFSLFMFIFAGNMIGLLPYSFTFTSQVIVNFALAFIVMMVITVIGFIKHGREFLRLFFPHGVPLWLAPLLIPIEVISYFIRPVSLAVRLFANMTAGHIMLKIFAYFTVGIGIFGVFPLAFNMALMSFEFFVAFLQAYVFTILSCIYMHDALYSH